MREKTIDGHTAAPGTPPLETVLADFREQATGLRLHGHTAQAASIERVCDAVAECMVAYLDWLTEDEAVSRSNRSREWLRGRFPVWQDMGLAAQDGRRRKYRRIIVPLRANVEAARAEAVRDARRVA